MVSSVRSLVKPSWLSLCSIYPAACMGLSIVATNKKIVSSCILDNRCAIIKAFVTRIIHHKFGFITVKSGWI